MKYKQGIIYLLLLFLIVGCGGGSSSDSSSSGEPSIPPTDPLPPPITDIDCKNTDSDHLGENTSEYWCAYVNTRDEVTGLFDPSYSEKSETILADFSFAGYMRGELPLPDTSNLDNYDVYDVTDFGAIANDDVSDKSAIKALVANIAEDRKGKTDYKPAMIYFPKGQFILNDSSDMVFIHPDLTEKELEQLQPIVIYLDNVVIRGEGSDTILFMKEKFLPVNPKEMWSTPYMLRIGAPYSSVSARANVIGDASAFSTKTIQVSQTRGFGIGDAIELSSKVTDPKVIDMFIEPYVFEKKHGNTMWTSLKSGLIRKSKHMIVDIQSNRLILDSPIPHDVQSNHNWNVTKIGSYSNIGVENLVLRGNWQDKFVHHGSADHDGAYSLLSLGRANNSWVRNVEFHDVNRALDISNSFNITNVNVSITGNGGHSAISVVNSNNILSKEIRDTANTWHASGVSKYTTTSVFSNSKYSSEKNIDLHGEQATNNLFEHNIGGWNHGYWGASIQNQPNHLKGLVFWNNVNTAKGDVYNYYSFMNHDSDYGRVIMPYVIGLTGTKTKIAHQSKYMHEMVDANKAYYPPSKLCDDINGQLECDGPTQAYVESTGKNVHPVSLYEAQLNLRIK